MITPNQPPRTDPLGGQGSLFDDRVQAWVHAEESVSGEAQKEREALLAALANSEYGTVEQKVARILKQYPETRDSHTRLAIKYWLVYEGEKMAQWDRLNLEVLLDLENFENIERAAQHPEHPQTLVRFRAVQDTARDPADVLLPIHCRATQGGSGDPVVPRRNWNW